MKPIEIRIELLRKGYSNVRLAAEVGRTESTVCNVIYGRSRSRLIANRIAAITGIPASRLWPETYGRQAGNRRAA